MKPSSKNTGDKLSQPAKTAPLCIGFDPDTSDLHPFLSRQFASTTIESFLIRWYQAVTDKINKPGTAIKLQSAFFEQFGPPGIAALEDITIDARRRNFYVILDAKRGDISTTMVAYGRAAYEKMHADALTILPWMGTDSLQALLPWLKAGKRVYIVWISSNKSGQKIQLQAAGDKQKSLAFLIYELFTKFAKKEGVTENLGWVLGATSLSTNVLNQLPKKPHHFLLPGIGAQGAKFDRDARTLIKQHPTSLFPISRGLIKPSNENRIESWEDYSKFVENQWKGFKAFWTKD